MKAIRDIIKYKSYIIYSIKSSLKAEVAGSFLSFIWWVLEPLSFMVIYSIVFGYIFNNTEEYYSVFIFIGNAIWGFFSKSISSSTTLIKQNEQIISKVYVPKHILLVIELGINAFKLLINGILVSIMMFIFGINITLSICLLPFIIFTLFVVTFGLCSIIMNIGVFIVDLSRLISIALNVLMYFSGIFYSVEDKIPKPYGLVLSTVNPIAFLLSSIRKVTIYGVYPNMILLFVWLLIGAILSIIGVRVLYKNENMYVKIM